MFRNFWNSLKIISASSLVLSGSFFIPNDAAMAGGFAETCFALVAVRSDGNVNLVGNCAKRNGVFVSSSINLSELIVNNGGNLAWQRGGGFQLSCTNITGFLFNRTYNLSARCGDGRGGFNTAIINLNSRISNQDGVLAADF